MPVPEIYVRKVETKYPVKYCSFLGSLFPGLNTAQCETQMAAIIREKWGPGWEAGLRAFARSIGAL